MAFVPLFVIGRVIWLVIVLLIDAPFLVRHEPCRYPLLAVNIIG
jgi:hypothetical protein